jgi:predicted AAA+ superfamily ATPase
MQIERAQLPLLLARLDETPQAIVFVTGPRQVGKSTLVRQALRDRPGIYLAADQADPQAVDSGLWGTEASISDASLGLVPKDARWLTQQWATARAKALQQAALTPQCAPFVLAIDEIQKIPRWSEVVKGLWDADRAAGVPMHVVLLGSSAWLMQQGMRESLQGRYEVLHLTHWSFAEMQRAFNVSVDEFIYFGGYPGSARLYGEGQRWRQYIRDAMIEPNIGIDILQMVRVDKPALLKNLFELGCGAYSGQIVALTKLLGELTDAGNTVTLSKYLQLLSQAELLTGLEKFAMQALRRRASPPKFNVHNTALMSALAGHDFDAARADHTHWGRLLESAVGAHLINTRQPDTQLGYWRESPLEVDFVLHGHQGLLAIEVKSGKKFAQPKGLEAFCSQYAKARPLLVGEGGVPVAEFLARPADDWINP